jgi:hypothetical protein
VDAALLGRYYARFGDHAVAIAQQACYMASGQLPQPPARQPPPSQQTHPQPLACGNADAAVTPYPLQDAT